MIKCLTFDLDDTLWPVVPVIEHMDKTLYSWLEANAPAYTDAFSPCHFSEMRSRISKEYPQLAHSVTSVRLKGLELGLLEAGYCYTRSTELADSAFEVALAARQEVSYFEHTWAVLDALREAGYRMGAISNGNADIHRVGLSEHFDFQYNAHDLGVEKPDPYVYQQVLQREGLAPSQVIHIGDNPVADVLGAQQLGIATIWVNVIGQQWRHQHRADAEIDCLSELPGAVAKLHPKGET
ncbi:MAG: HAD family hydrolase [Pseudomonadales bacterium]